MPGPENASMVQMIFGGIFCQGFTLKTPERMNVVVPRIGSLKRFGCTLVKQNLLFILLKEKAILRIDHSNNPGLRTATSLQKPQDQQHEYAL